MSGIDDKAFDEYLSRESQLSKRYRTLEAEEIPAELDSRILAQARDAVAGKSAGSRKKNAWTRWSAPLALAASMVLVIGIVLQSGTQHEVTSQDLAKAARRKAPLPQAAAPADKSVRAESELSPSSEQRANGLAKAESEPQPAQVVPIVPVVPPQELDRLAIVPAPEPAAIASAASSTPPPVARAIAVRPAPAAEPPQEVVVNANRVVESPQNLPVGVTAMDRPPVATATPPYDERERRQRDAAGSVSGDLSEVIITGSYRKQIPRQGVGPRETIAPKPAGYAEDQADANLEQQDREADPQLWLKHIRELRGEGKRREADREWQRFRKAYPQYPVEDNDAARAK